MANDYISRQAAIDRINKQREHLQPDVYPQDKIVDAAYRICAEFIERLPSAQPTQSNAPNTLDAISRQDAVSRFSDLLMVELRGERLPTWNEVYNAIKELPSAQPDGWLEQNKDKILQAGMEGREIDFRIGGRLFAIREKAQ